MKHWKLLLTLAACFACGALLVTGLVIEWQAAPDWVSPRKFFTPNAMLWNSWYRWFFAEAAQVALLVWIRRGRFLLGWTGVKVLLVVILTLARWQTALAYFTLTGLSILAAGIGSRILRVLVPELVTSFLERLLLSLVLGYGALGFVAFGLALAFALQFFVVAGVLVLLIIVFRADCGKLIADGVAAAKATYAARRDVDWRLGATVLALLATCFVSALVVALSDEIDYDSMAYHLSIPQLYVIEGGLVDLPECSHAHFCHGVELLYTLGLVLAGQPLPQLMHCLAGLMTAGLVYCLGRRLAGAAAGWLAALAFYALPMTTWESGHALSDLFVTLYVFAALYTAVLWVDTGYRRLLLLTGCFAGLAIGGKLNALLFVCPLEGLVLCRLLWLRRERQWPRGVLHCGLTTLAVCAPWLALEWLRTGNPVYPFYNAIFKSPLWDSVNDHFDFALFGFAHGVTYFLRLPWHLCAWPGQFGQANAWGAVEGLSLVCLPITCLLWPRRLWHLLWLPGGVLLGGSLLWFTQVQYLRYLLPIVPIMSLLAAVNGLTLWAAFGTNAWRRAALAAVALVLGLCWFADTRWWATKLTGTDGYPTRLVFGRETSEEYLRRQLPEYDPLCYLAVRANERATRVLTYPRHLRLYGGQCMFYHRAFAATDHALLMRNQRIPIEDGPRIMRALVAEPVEYLLLSYDHEYQPDPEFACLLTDPVFLKEYCRLIMTRDGFYHRRVCLYQFKPESVSCEASEAPSAAPSPTPATTQ